MDLVSVTITLFLIMDPFGNIPVFLSVLDKVPPERRRRVLVRELFLALAVIVVFIFFGRFALTVFGLTQDAVSIGGGIILFLIAVRMVFPRRQAEADDEFEGDPILVPLAVPMIAGPSMLAVLLLFATADPGRMAELLASAGIAWAGTFVVLFSSTLLARLLTRRGLAAIERLMGMILVALSVQLFLDGLSHYLGR